MIKKNIYKEISELRLGDTLANVILNNQEGDNSIPTNDQIVAAFDSKQYRDENIKLLMNLRDNIINNEAINMNIGTEIDNVAELNEKFRSNLHYQLNFGDKESFIAGLGSYLENYPKDPNILANMLKEHESIDTFTPSNYPSGDTSPFNEWCFVVNDDFLKPMLSGKTKDNKLQNEYREKISLNTFMKHNNSIEAGLTIEEIIAARLYTGPMFKKYNEVLRNPKAFTIENRFIYTIHVFASCIIKLSRIHSVATVYRGIKGGLLPSCFLNADKYGTKGGVESGFMSTTTNQSVAFKYAAISDKDDTKASYIFEIDEGAIDRGADISWLSQYPQEAEVVFPPLTSLQVIGEPRIIGGSILIKLRPNINLRLQTFEEVINKSKSNTIDSIDWYIDDIKNFRFDFDIDDIQSIWLKKYISKSDENTYAPWIQELVKYREDLSLINGIEFNKQAFYREVIDHALDLKSGLVKKVYVLKALYDYNLEKNNKFEFEKNIKKLITHSGADFSNDEFIMKYVKYSTDENNLNDNIYKIKNYDLLWSLPIQNITKDKDHINSWTKLIKSLSTDSVTNLRDDKSNLIEEKSDLFPCVSISMNNMSILQKLLVILVTFKFVRDTLEPIMGRQIVETMYGYGGLYYYIGCNTNQSESSAIYQLIRARHSRAVNEILSPIYIYKKNNKWHVGQTIDSDVAFLRSVDDYFSDSISLNDKIIWEHFDKYKNTILNSSNIMINNSYDENYSFPIEFASTPMKRDNDVIHSNNPLNRRTKHLASKNKVRLLQKGIDQLYAYIHRVLREEEITGIDSSISATEMQSIKLFCSLINCECPKEIMKRLKEVELLQEKISNKWVNIMLKVCLCVAFFLIASLLSRYYVKTSYVNEAGVLYFTRGIFSSITITAFIFCIVALFEFFTRDKYLLIIFYIFLLVFTSTLISFFVYKSTLEGYHDSLYYIIVLEVALVSYIFVMILYYCCFV